MRRIILTSILFGCSSAMAQTPSATILPETRPVVQSERGKVHSCGVTFSAFVSDHAYKNGNYVALVGSINMTYAKGKMPAATFKLQTADVVESTNGKLQQISFSPSYAYFIARNGSSARKEVGSFECEGGGWCAAYTDTGVIELAAGAFYGEAFSVAYTRPAGKTDVVAAIPGKAFNETQDCFQKLIERYGAQD